MSNTSHTSAKSTKKNATKKNAQARPVPPRALHERLPMLGAAHRRLRAVPAPPTPPPAPVAEPRWYEPPSNRFIRAAVAAIGDAWRPGLRGTDDLMAERLVLRDCDSMAPDCRNSLGRLLVDKLARGTDHDDRPSMSIGVAKTTSAAMTVIRLAMGNRECEDAGGHEAIESLLFGLEQLSELAVELEDRMRFARADWSDDDVTSPASSEPSASAYSKGA